MASSPSLGTASLIKDRLISIVGAPYVLEAEPHEAIQAIQDIQGMAPQWVVTPGSEQEVASILRFANDAHLAVIPRGGGTKLGWGNPPERCDLILSLARLDRVEEHAWADLTVTVETGRTVARLQQTLAEHGQRLAVDPLWPERATVGGMLSSNDTGTLRLSHCGLRDLLIGVTLVLADGTVAKSGGKVVKNVAGYDLPKLATGALGTVGVITRAIFRVHPLPVSKRTLVIRAQSISEMERVVLQLLDSNLAYTALQTRLASYEAPVVDIGLEGAEAGLAAQESRIRHEIQAGMPVDSTSIADCDVWQARQNLWTPPGAAIAKLSVLPSEIGKTFTALTELARLRNAVWRAAMQGSGIGWLRLEAAPEDSVAILEALRARAQAGGGSLVVLSQPGVRGKASMDAWGAPGDTLPLMRALKRQFDPQGTLNPGRYLGGI